MATEIAMPQTQRSHMLENEDSHNVSSSTKENDGKEGNRRKEDVRMKGKKIPKRYALAQTETDQKRLKSRQKQIDYGTNTIGYENYRMKVQRNKRKRADPQTPDKYQRCSKRSWDAQLRKWRKQLHKYDPPRDEDEIIIEFENEENASVEENVDKGDDTENSVTDSAGHSQSNSVRSIYDDFEELP